jgi:hypothetical protein
LIRSRAADIRGELAALRVYAGMPEEAFSHKIIREDLGDLEEFLEAVGAHVEAEGGGL